MRLIRSLIAIGILLIINQPLLMSQNTNSIHQFVVQDIDGNDFKLEELKGTKVMIVNTASKCGFTGQYKGLQELYSQYKDAGFTIVAFPANNFLGQEPGSNEEIAQFCEAKFGVEFPMMGKISVKGKDQHPLYSFLTQKAQNGVLDSKISWNFHKFLVDENGVVVESLAAGTKPNDASIVNWITGS